MKKYHYICLFFICLIATSCENTVFEKDVPAVQPTTRSIPEDFTDYNTYFLDLSSVDYGAGTESMTGTLKSYGKEVEYHFILFCALTGDVKCKMETSDGDIIYNGQNPTKSIYGISGQKIEFIHRNHYPDGETYITFKIERGSSNTLKSAEARLLVDKVIYNGEQITKELKGCPDMYLRMTVPGEPGSGYPDSGSSAYHWICKKCNFSNSISNQTCLNCGSKKP